jgi:tRNA 2-thiouridine synthesizing protein B
MDCLNNVADTDSIILIEDAVVAADASSPFAEALKDKTVYALEADLKARGILSRLNKAVKASTDVDFVALTVQHDSSLSWY